MLARLIRRASVAALLIVGTDGICADGPTAEPLTAVTQIRSLPPADAALSRRVRLRGIVTYYHYLPEWSPLFVQDATGGIYVQVSSGDLGLRAGDEVEVEGVTGAGRFAPLVVDPRVRRVGRQPLPHALRRTLDELLDGAYDSQWVEVEGVVRRIERHPSAGLYLLTLAASRRTYRAVVRPSEAVPAPSLVDARVRVRGAAGTLFTQKRQIVGVQILTPGFENVTVVSPPPLDPFGLPVRPVGGLFQFDPQGTSGQRVRVGGTVTATDADAAAFVFMKDGTGGLRIDLEAPMPGLQPGDVVDAVGFPELGEYSPTLEDAQVRKVSAGASPEARLVTVDDVMSGDYDSLPVEIEGVLADQSVLRSHTRLLLKAGSQTFEATIGKGQPPGLREGDSIRLRGICLAEPGPDNRVHSFRVAVASPADVTVLDGSGWWTSDHALWTMAAFCGVMGLGWNVRLRRRAEGEAERARVLQGLLPICAECKRVRSDREYWDEVESHLRQLSSTDPSHGLCPACRGSEPQGH